VKDEHPSNVVSVRGSSVTVVSAMIVVTPPSTITVVVPEVSSRAVTVKVVHTVFTVVKAGVESEQLNVESGPA